MKKMNLANQITMFRVIMIPVFLIFCYLPFAAGRYLALIVFVLASASDFLDGYIARSRNLVTDFGKFMDPLADKVLVTAAMLILVDWRQMPAWVLAVVITRGFAVSGMRMIAATDGKVIAATSSGKVKTASTMICIILIWLLSLPAVNLVGWLLILITTVYSGVEYFIQNWNILWD